MCALHASDRIAVGPGSQLLDPLVLQRMGNLELVARGVVEGFLHGLHRSPFTGRSLDFAEHRPYAPGDDLRRVDWALLARTDRYFVKEFEAETNANFTVYLDCSSSMDFASRGVTKLEYAKYLAASLSYLARRQGDRVGAVTFDAGVRDVIPCSARNLDLVLLTLDRATAERPGDLAAAFEDVVTRPVKRGLVAVVSDLYGDPERLATLLGRLRAAGSDVLVFHLLDNAELDLPWKGAITVRDLETGATLPVAPEALREEYRARIEEHIRDMSLALAAVDAEHTLVDTAVPLDAALYRYLSIRQDRRRTGRWASPS
jgi:uncharacterized protein (DUF58 family)